MGIKSSSEGKTGGGSPVSPGLEILPPGIQFNPRDVTQILNSELTIHELTAKLEQLTLQLEDETVVRNKLESDLKKSDERYHLLVDNAVEGVAVIQGRILKLINPIISIFIGYTQEELLSMPISYLLDPDDKETLLKFDWLEDGNIKREHLAYEIKAKNGNSLLVEDYCFATSWEGKPASLHFISDLTNILATENALTQSEEKLRIIFESASDSIVTTDINGMITDVNNATLILHQYESKNELIGRSITGLIIENARPSMLSIVRQTIESGKSSTVEFSCLTSKGMEFPAELSVALIRNNSDKPAGITIISRNITERKVIENNLQQSEAKYRSLVDSAGAVIASINLSGELNFVNETACQLMGYTKAELLGKPFTILVHEDDRDQLLDKFILALNEETPGPHLEFRAMCNDGNIVWFTTHPTKLKIDGKVAGFSAILHDITEHKRMESELLKTQKLEAIGLLAGGIAHDFNNILMAITGNISLAKLDIFPGESIYTKLEEVEKASFRAKDLTQQLLTFSRGGAPIKKTASIRELLIDSVNFALRGANIDCRFSIANNLWNTEIDTGQISQVINNMVINAKEAMPDGGCITVTAENFIIDKAFCSPLRKGHYIKLSIEDQGIGIHQNDLPKLFDPYFTTKESGHGLGLSTSYSIIKNHDGWITAQSKLGEGTVFRIFLPATLKKIVKHAMSNEISRTQSGRVMIMDDDQTIREIGASMLTCIGYNEVEYATNGDNAVTMFRQAKEAGKPFDLIILDLTVPGGKGGKDIIRQLIEINPGVKAIVSSGYANDPVMSKFADYGFDGVIAKPYTIAELSKVIDEITRR